MTTLVQLIQYDKWANDRVVEFLTRSNGGTARALQVLDHILFAQEVWLCRIKGRRYEKPSSELLLADYANAFQKTYDEYFEFLSWLQEDELDSIVEYSDSKGNPWSSSLRDIIMHVCNHGTYHRGQIAMLTRDAGGEPVSTDYIFMKREAKD